MGVTTMNGLKASIHDSRSMTWATDEQCAVLRRVSRYVAMLATVSVTIVGAGPVLAQGAANPSSLNAITSKSPQRFPTPEAIRSELWRRRSVSAQCPAGASTVISDTNDVISSQGVFHSVLNATVPGQAADDTTSIAYPDGLQVGGSNVRRVEQQNAPTVINVIFNKLQLWDGRAKEVFNGANIKGATDTSAFVYQARSQGALLSKSSASP